MMLDDEEMTKKKETKKKKVKGVCVSVIQDPSK